MALREFLSRTPRIDTGVNPERKSSGGIVVITNKDIDSPGGQEASIRNMLLKFPGRWTLISPHRPAGIDDANFIHVNGELAIPFSDKLIKGSSAHLVTPNAIHRVNKELQDRNPKAILIDDWQRIFGISLFYGLPPDLKRKSYAIWRGIINENYDTLQDSELTH